jgi:hypothetical protein
MNSKNYNTRKALLSYQRLQNASSDSTRQAGLLMYHWYRSALRVAAKAGPAMGVLQGQQRRLVSVKPDPTISLNSVGLANRAFYLSEENVLISNGYDHDNRIMFILYIPL